MAYVVALGICVTYITLLWWLKRKREWERMRWDAIEKLLREQKENPDAYRFPRFPQ